MPLKAVRGAGERKAYMSTVWVRFGDSRDYPIRVEPGNLKLLGSLARPRVKGKTACLITHARINRLYGRIAETSLRGAGFHVHKILVPEGETSKSLAQAERIIGRMLDRHADRSAFIVALGGGVIGDLAGFVAATYMRGIEYIQVPTSLLAQVDSSVGGKVAVNHPRGKNLMGAFLQPRLVVSDPGVLQSLSRRQFRVGLAEVIKSAIIADAGFFRDLEKALPKILRLNLHSLSWMIARSCALKARIVEKDETEQGLRAILNYGHTLGHALETFYKYRGYLHGEAISVGMAAAARLALETGVCRQETVDSQERILRQAGLPVRGRGEPVNAIWRIMQTDKKVKEGDNNFILTPNIGHARIFKKIGYFSVQRVLKAVLGGAGG